MSSKKKSSAKSKALELILQGTPEWYAARCGKVTASLVHLVTAAKDRAGRRNYMARLVAERLTGIASPSFQSEEMRWGIEHEAQAREAYHFLNGVKIDPVGFILHPGMPMAGASPDGRIGKTGGVEFKCPNTATHIDFVLTKKIPSRYLYQIDWQFACDPPRQWCDYVSFDPRLPSDLQLCQVRIARDKDRVRKLEKAVLDFLTDLGKMMAQLKSKHR